MQLPRRSLPSHLYGFIFSCKCNGLYELSAVGAVEHNYENFISQINSLYQVHISNNETVLFVT
jgi:hypothetical protein